MPRKSSRRKGEGGSPFLHLALCLAALVISCLWLGGCGLETVSVLSQPGFSSPSSTQLIVTHNLVNNLNNFRGYEIYYRGYYDQASAQSARNQIENATGQLSATPESMLSTLVSQGFTRIFDSNGNDGNNGIRPIFEVTTAEQTASTALEFDIYLVLQNAQTPPQYTNWYYIKSTDSSTQNQITRSLSTPGPSTTVSFQSSYSPGVDFTGSSLGAGASSGQTIYFVFFAVTYGVAVNSASFSASYSLPVSLYKEIPYTLP
jgi:hypothetical protein